VKVGTLVLGEIPTHIAQNRQRLAMQRSVSAVAEQEQAYEGAARPGIRGEVGAEGSGPLRPGEEFHPNAVVDDKFGDFLDERRNTGIEIRPQG
jgi:hypothetical protein